MKFIFYFLKLFYFLHPPLFIKYNFFHFRTNESLNIATIAEFPEQNTLKMEASLSWTRIVCEKKYKLPKNTNNKHSEQLWSWFLKLTAEERVGVLSIEDKQWIISLRQMYKTKRKKGEGLFFSLDEEAKRDMRKLRSKLQIETQDDTPCFQTLQKLLNSCFYPESFLAVRENLKILRLNFLG
jgi:hypothetical protein